MGVFLMKFVLILLLCVGFMLIGMPYQAQVDYPVQGPAQDISYHSASVPVIEPAEPDHPPAMDKFDLYLLLGQSNMASRAPVPIFSTGRVDRAYLLNGEDRWEPASFGALRKDGRGVQGYNRYSSVELPDKINGFSMGYPFAQEIVRVVPGRSIGLIYNAIGGTALGQWQKGADTGYFEEAVRRTRVAMKSGTLRAILWHQGERDRNNREYMTQLRKFVQDLRGELGVDDADVPFLAGELLPMDSFRSFNRMISDIGQWVPDSDYVDSTGISDIGDGLHINAKGQKVLGRRYAEKVLRMVYGKSE